MKSPTMGWPIALQWTLNWWVRPEREMWGREIKKDFSKVKTIQTERPLFQSKYVSSIERKILHWSNYSFQNKK